MNTVWIILFSLFLSTAQISLDAVKPDRLLAEEANENAAASPFTVPISATSRYGEVFITPDPYGSGYKLTYLKGEETDYCKITCLNGSLSGHFLDGGGELSYFPAQGKDRDISGRNPNSVDVLSIEYFDKNDRLTAFHSKVIYEDLYGGLYFGSDLTP